MPTMQLFGGQEVPYVHRDGWRATELRYAGPDADSPLAMTLIMPKDLAAFEATMTPKQLTRIAKDLARERTRLQTDVDGEDCGTYPYSLALYLPRFSIDTRLPLKDKLDQNGMHLAFSPKADLTGIHDPASDGESVKISEVIHQANIDVDETGTEAAAATAVGGDTGGCLGPSPAKEVKLRLDHPFLFFLRDVKTGAILFMGHVVDPSVTR